MENKERKWREINKILVANRGEIALRIIKTCKKMGIATVAVYSEVDSEASFVKEASQAVLIGPPPSSKSYLSIDAIIQAAKQTKADAIHPGYGFLSENSEFAERCEKEGLEFVGPSSHTIFVMGSKQRAKKILEEREPSIPLIPGYTGQDQSLPTISLQASKIGNQPFLSFSPFFFHSLLFSLLSSSILFSLLFFFHSPSFFFHSPSFFEIASNS